MENENKVEIEVVEKKKINKKIIIGLFLIVMLFFLSPFLFPQTIIKIDLAYNKWTSERVFKDLEYNNSMDVEEYIENNKEKFISDFGEQKLLSDFDKIKDVDTSELYRKNMIFKYNTIFLRTDEGKNEIAIYISPEKIYINIDLLEKDISLCSEAICGFVTIWECVGADVDVLWGYIDNIANENSWFATGLLLVTFSAKPVIYLYPEEELELEVKLDNVAFTTTYPLYQDAWNIIARPDGTLIDKNNREYNYLYWEGYTNYQVDLSEGFVVSKDNYIKFLEDKLEYVGLSDKEACDFISYWLPLMNEYDYCLVSFQKDYGEKVKIEYSVEPNNELVVFVGIKGLDEQIEISEQDLSCYKEFSREGFVVVEWGGRIIE